jgi:hypothetical protein
MYSKLFLSIQKVNIGYYAQAAQTTLNLYVFLCAFTLTTLNPSLPHQGFLTSSFRISKRVTFTVPVSNHNDIGAPGREGF